MIVKLSFDPKVDSMDSVLSAVVGAFGMTDSAVFTKSDHDHVGAAQQFAEGVNSHGQHFQPSAEAAAAALSIAQQQQGAVASPAATAQALQAAQHINVELDKDGLPWDERIHADGKDKKTRAGYWKKKKGATPELIQKVQEELRARLASAASVQVEGAASIPPGGVLGQIQTDNGPAAAAAGPVAPGPVAPGPVAPPAVAADPTSSFAAFMAYTMQYVQNPNNPAGVLTAAHLGDIAAQLQLINPDSGIPEIRMLDQRPDLLQMAKQWVDHYVANPGLLGPQKTGLPGQ